MRHRRCRDGISQDRLTLDIDPVDDRLVRGSRQVGANALDRILDVVDCGLRIHLEPKLDKRCRIALGDGRDDVLDAGNIGDRILDALRHLRFQLARRDARIDDCDVDQRHVDVGKAGDRELRKAHQTKHHQNEEKEDRGNRLADRPGGEIGMSTALPRQFVATGVMTSPSRTKVPARATTVLALGDAGCDLGPAARRPARVPPFFVVTLPSVTLWRNASEPL